MNRLFLPILLSLYVYIIFFLGILHVLFKPVVSSISFIFILVSILFLLKMKENTQSLLNKLKLFFFQKSSIFFLSLLSVQVGINLIGALGYETAFDAIWYHLTLPKLYLLQHTITHIPGGLLYYSDMPKLGELLYIGALAIADERLANLMQLFAGLVVCLVMYKLAAMYMPKKMALLAIIIFYSNIAVAWESTVAYIDLIRSVFEILALWNFLQWYVVKQKQYFIASALCIGLAMTTKILGVGSLAIFILLFLYIAKTEKKSFSYIIKNVCLYIAIAFLVPLPWIVFSYFYTGNPVYPFFTSLYPTGININILNPLLFLQTIIQLFTSAADPISPIYLIALPLGFWKYKTFSKEMRLLSWYSLFALLIWYITPQTGGGRFIIPYLPAFSILVAYLLFLLPKQKDIWNSLYKNILLGLIIFLALVTIVYRGVASLRYLPVIFGNETKSKFLSNNLNFSFGDFYDTDGYFMKHIKSSDTILLFGFHNLYYIDFPFIDSSWIEKGDRFTYIACQNTVLPKRFSHWQLVYVNKKTHVNLYSDGGRIWKY